MPQFRVRAMMDIVEEEAKKTYTEFKADYYTTDLNRVLKDPEVDAVYVCTHHNNHVPISISAAEAGKHIFCEKPLALTIEECRRMEETVKETRVQFMMGFPQRFSTLSQKAKELVPTDQTGVPKRYKKRLVTKDERQSKQTVTETREMAKTEKPNILFIFTDQHRLSAVGCYGETPCQTPNIDKLAQTGIRFETAYTVCPVCSPARATVMTGLYPHSHGVCSNVHNLGASVHELTDRPELLSRQLLALGYTCGYSGKWHLGTDRKTAFGSYNRPTLPKDVGFKGQSFPGHGGGGFNYPEYRQYLAEHGYEHKVTQPKEQGSRAFGRLTGVLEGPVESTVPYFLAENSINLMEQAGKAGQPFFVWHNFWGPHGPYFTTREFYDLYANVEIPEWPNFRWPSRAINGPHQVKIHPRAEQLTWEDWVEAIRYYYAFTSLIDSQIGRMVHCLDRTGQRQNTIIIFTADHGQALGSHGGLVDKGWHHFEEIQRIPFIVCMPETYYGEGLKPGDVLQEWVSLADVYPTILEFAGTDRRQVERHGRSIVPLLRREQVSWREAIFVEFNGVNSLAASMVSVRKRNLKYGWNCSNRDELYDLKADPHETTNLIHDPKHADAVIDMRKLIEAWMTEKQYPGMRTYQRSRQLTKHIWKKW